MQILFIVLGILSLFVAGTLSCSNCCKPRDCQDIKELRIRKTVPSGNYVIYPDGTNGIEVRCDMSTDGGGWTVIQRRYSSYNFYKNWADYEKGFGTVGGNHWLGNYAIHHITTGGWYELRVDLVHAGASKYAKYDRFRVGGPETEYRLSVNGYSGTAGDSFTHHDGAKFSTYDNDNDSYSGNCASLYTGAWWYKSCHKSNLNGAWGSTTYGKGVNWQTLTGYLQSATRTEMKIRRTQP